MGWWFFVNYKPEQSGVSTGFESSLYSKSNFEKKVLGTGTVHGARVMEREDIVPGTQRWQILCSGFQTVTPGLSVVSQGTH